MGKIGSLVLFRYINEGITLKDKDGNKLAHLTVTKTRKNMAAIRIEADTDIKIYRDETLPEVLNAIPAEETANENR